MTPFDAVERVADAVLYEGYVLYPYRASAQQNQFRWQFGVLAPRSPAGDGEPWFSQTDCVIEPEGADPRISIRARFLRPSPSSAPENADATWLEGVPEVIGIDAVPIDTLLTMERTAPLERTGVEVRLTVRAARRDGFVTLRIRLENGEPWQDEFARNRDRMLTRSLVGAHLLLAVEGGRFVSLLEPPDRAAAVVAACENRHTWPVLAGDRTARNQMLSSPIVLYDFPGVAAESPGDLCDASEIDEILSLRILTPTEEEKREARATDQRAREILDRVESLTLEAWSALHGATRGSSSSTRPTRRPRRSRP